MQEFNQDRELTIHSPFEVLAQAVVDVIYLKPFPGFQATHDNINRHVHGALHVTRCVMNALMFIDLYKKYKPELVVSPNGDALTSKDIKLLKLAVLYHDAANINDSEGDELEHARVFTLHMQTLGYTESEVFPYAYAISHKDANAPKTFLQKIVHDADCLDILRVIRDSFDKNYLDIITDLGDIPDFRHELDQIISNHIEAIQYMEGNNIYNGEENPSELHTELETSSNCFMSVRATLYHMLYKDASKICLSQNKLCSIGAIDFEKMSVLNLYNREQTKNTFVPTASWLTFDGPSEDIYDSIMQESLSNFILELQKLFAENVQGAKWMQPIYLCVNIVLKIANSIQDKMKCYSFIEALFSQYDIKENFMLDECFVRQICAELLLAERLDIFELFISRLKNNQIEDIHKYLLGSGTNFLNIKTTKEALHLLFKAGLSLNSVTVFGGSENSLLCDIIESNIFSFRFLQWLIGAHPEPLVWDQANLKGHTPLHKLVKFGRLDCLEYVLSQGVNLNTINCETLRPIDTLSEIVMIYPTSLSYNKRKKILQLFHKYGSESIYNGLPAEIDDFSVLQMLNKYPAPEMLEPAPKDFLIVQQFKRELGWLFISKRNIDADVQLHPMRSMNAFGINFMVHDYTESFDYRLLVHTIRGSDKRSLDTIRTKAEFLNSSNRNFSCSLVDKTHSPAVGHVLDDCFPFHFVLDIPYQRLLCCYPQDISSPISEDNEYNERLSNVKNQIDSKVAMLGYFHLKSQGFVAPPSIIFNQYAAERFITPGLPFDDIYATNFAGKLPTPSPDQTLQEKSFVFKNLYSRYLTFLPRGESLIEEDDVKQDYSTLLDDNYNEIVVSPLTDNTKKIACKAVMIDVGFLDLYMRFSTTRDPMFERNREIMQSIVTSGLPIILIKSLPDMSLSFRDESNILLGAYLRVGIALKYNAGSKALFDTKYSLYKMKADAIKILSAIVELEEKYEALNQPPEPKYLMYFYKSLRSDIRLKSFELQPVEAIAAKNNGHQVPRW